MVRQSECLLYTRLQFSFLFSDGPCIEPFPVRFCLRKVGEEGGGGGGGVILNPKAIRLSTIHLVAAEKNGDLSLTLISQFPGQYIRAVYGLSRYTCSSSFVADVNYMHDIFHFSVLHEECPLPLLPPVKINGQ
jgi:hypothetical protein